MKVYNSFIGIDIGKFNFVVANYANKVIEEYENTPKGIKLFIKKYKQILPKSLCVLEATGGYEMPLLKTLCDKNFDVHRANTRKVKNFIRSFGNKAKTDVLDARALAMYGYERKDRLEKFTLTNTNNAELYALAQRRLDLKKMIVAEKNRCQFPGTEIIKKSCQAVLTLLDEQVEEIDIRIQEQIDKNEVLKNKKEVLKTVPGIGNIVAGELLALLPELGKISRREIASLAGVAPMSNDSGRKIGYRSTGRGRDAIKPILFIAAMAARNSKTSLKTFYEQLIARGKKKMVALVALMRKILVIANARLKPLCTI